MLHAIVRALSRFLIFVSMTAWTPAGLLVAVYRRELHHYSATSQSQSLADEHPLTPVITKSRRRHIQLQSHRNCPRRTLRGVCLGRAVSELCLHPSLLCYKNQRINGNDWSQMEHALKIECG
jgi:hypothetical protein